MIYPVTCTTALDPADRTDENTERGWKRPVSAAEMPQLLVNHGGRNVRRLGTYTFSAEFRAGTDGVEVRYFVLEHDETGDPDLLARAYSDEPELNRVLFDAVYNCEWWTVLYGPENNDTEQIRLIECDLGEAGLCWLVDGDGTIWATKAAAARRFIQVVAEDLIDDARGKVATSISDETPSPSSVVAGYKEAQWLEKMQSVDGLHPRDGGGRWADEEIKAFVGRLAEAGWAVRSEPLGPRGGRRWRLHLHD